MGTMHSSESSDSNMDLPSADDRSPIAESMPDGGDPDRLLLALLDETRLGLEAVGIRMEVVKFQAGRAEIVGEPASPRISQQSACEFCRKLLENVQGALGDAHTTLVETQCGITTANPCAFILTWKRSQAVGIGSPINPSSGPDDFSAAVQTGESNSASDDFPSVTSPLTRGAEPCRTDGVDVPLAPHPRTSISAAFEALTWLTRLIPAWLTRRWWILSLCLLAGLAGGAFARISQTPMYAASAELVVASGAGGQGPGAANDAIALALTDASIVPTDQNVMRSVGAALGTSSQAVAGQLSASVETGTSIVLLSYRAPSPAAAVRGVNLVAHAITGGDVGGSAFPRGSLVTVRLANDAASTGTLHTFGIPLGALLGLIAGLIAAIAMERADPRADDLDDLLGVTRTGGSESPGSVSMEELKSVIAQMSEGAATITLVPLSSAEADHVVALHDGLTRCVPAINSDITVGDPVESGGTWLTQSAGPTVLVVVRSAPLRHINATVQRLQKLGRPPVWAVLARATSTASGASSIDP
jgi:capsular polysaccharide biosynthesis protein